MALRLSPHMTVMQNAAQKASKRLLRDFNEVEQLQVSIKGPSDFVSQADLRAESTMREELGRARPGYSFLMEESGMSGSANWAWRWIVDPLDGTSNFLHGIPHWCISIALERRLQDGGSEIAAAMIYNPVRRRAAAPTSTSGACACPPGASSRTRCSPRASRSRPCPGPTGWRSPARSAC